MCARWYAGIAKTAVDKISNPFRGKTACRRLVTVSQGQCKEESVHGQQHTWSAELPLFGLATTGSCVDVRVGRGPLRPGLVMTVVILAHLWGGAVATAAAVPKVSLARTLARLQWKGAGVRTGPALLRRHGVICVMRTYGNTAACGINRCMGEMRGSCVWV